jgi:hypothetical protein
MAAQIQRIEENVDLGQTLLTVGPAKHLGHEDLAGLLRMYRRRQVSYRLAERTSGEATGNAVKVHGGEQLPRSDSVFQPSAGGVGANTPFELLDASDVTGLKVMVNVNSFLLNSLTPNDTQSITGLGTAMAVEVGTQIWLEVDFSGYTASAAAIGSGTSGWSGFPSPFAFSGSPPSSVLLSAFLLVGYLAAATSTLDGTVITGGPASAPVSAKIIQCVWQDLLLRNGAYNGQAVVFPFPHCAPLE